MRKKGLNNKVFRLPLGHTISKAKGSSKIKALDIIALKENKSTQVIISSKDSMGYLIQFMDKEAYWPHEWDHDPKEWFRVGSLMSKPEI